MMKDNEEKIIRGQFEEKLDALEEERRKLEEKFEDNQVLTKVLRIECNEAKGKNKELKNENDILKSRCLNIESLLKTKDLELSEIKDQLQILWDQTHNLANLSTNKSITNSFVRKNNYTETKSNDIDTAGKCYCNHSSSKLSQKEIACCVDATTNTKKCLSTDASSNTITLQTSDACSNTTESMKPPMYSFLYDVSNYSSSHTSPLHSIVDARDIEIIENKNLERVRTIVIAELTSLQLLHSMFDLTSTSTSDSFCQAGGSRNSLHTSRNNISDVPKDIDQQLITGYRETCFNGERLSQYNSASDSKCESPGKSQKKDSIVYETILGNTNANQDLSNTLSPESKTQSLSGTDKTLLLYMEMENQRKLIDDELIKLSHEIFGDIQLFTNCNNCLLKRDIYSQLVETLSHPDTSSKFNIDKLEHLLNLILVDHSVTSCLLALSHRSKSVDMDDMVHQLCRFKSTSTSSKEPCIPKHEETEVDEVDTIDNVVPYVYPNNLSVMISDMDISGNEIYVDDRISSDSEPDSPKHVKKKFFCCLPLKLIKQRTPRREKLHEKRLLTED